MVHKNTVLKFTKNMYRRKHFTVVPWVPESGDRVILGIRKSKSPDFEAVWILSVWIDIKSILHYALISEQKCQDIEFDSKSGLRMMNRHCPCSENRISGNRGTTLLVTSSTVGKIECENLETSQNLAGLIFSSFGEVFGVLLSFFMSFSTIL